MSVSLFIENAKGKRRIILSFVTCLDLLYFSISHKGGKFVEREMCFDFLYDILWNTSLCNKNSARFGSVSSPLCAWKLERVYSQTQRCQLRRFNDYTRRLHVSAFTGHFQVVFKRTYGPAIYIVRARAGEISTYGSLPPPATRPPLAGGKRKTPLRNTSAPTNFKLDTSHQTLSCL